MRRYALFCLFLLSWNLCRSQEISADAGSAQSSMRIALETRKKALTKKTINILNKFKEESRSGVNSKVSSILNFGRAGLFSIDSASLRGSLVFARGYFQEASLMYSQNLGLQASVKGIPLNIDILHSDYPSYGDMRTLSNGFRYSFSFDHERYIRLENRSQLLTKG